MKVNAFGSGHPGRTDGIFDSKISVRPSVRRVKIIYFFFLFYLFIIGRRTDGRTDFYKIRPSVDPKTFFPEKVFFFSHKNRSFWKPKCKEKNHTGVRQNIGARLFPFFLNRPSKKKFACSMEIFVQNWKLQQIFGLHLYFGPPFSAFFPLSKRFFDGRTFFFSKNKKTPCTYI